MATMGGAGAQLFDPDVLKQLGGAGGDPQAPAMPAPGGIPSLPPPAPVQVRPAPSMALPNAAPPPAATVPQPFAATPVGQGLTRGLQAIAARQRQQPQVQYPAMPVQNQEIPASAPVTMPQAMTADQWRQPRRTFGQAIQEAGK